MAKLILRNGRNYGDVARYRDLISKPTINTKTVEAESTSASLDIFKYISKEDYEDLTVKNPHCVYAICDEDGFVREYFFNGYQRYEMQDYRIVSDLTTEDPTVLFYLNEDTKKYSKGFYVYTSTDEDPEEFEFRKIYEPVVDAKTIYLTPNGNMSTEIGGYILDESKSSERILINNGVPYEYEAVDDNKIALKFKYNMYRYYTPNTKYKFRFNYSGDVSEKTFFPTGLEGVNNVYKFSPEEFIMYLPADLYPSTDLEDYHLTLTWYEPTDISTINPLFIKVNSNNFELINGRYHTDSLINAYTSISKVTEYLYETFYEGCDYQFAENYFNNHPEVYIYGASNTFKGSTLVGRDFGRVYDESAEFVVRTPERTGRMATVGVASMIPDLTKEKVENGDYSEEYGIIPFMVNDAINKAGVMATFHSVPCDKGRCTITSPDIKTNLTLNVNMLVRYIVDNYTSATEAVQYIKDHVSIIIPSEMQDIGYIPSISVIDENSFFVIEFIENRNIVRNLNKSQFLNNFYTDGVTYSYDLDPEEYADIAVFTPLMHAKNPEEWNPVTKNGLTEHSYGLESTNTIRFYSQLTPLTNKAQIREILDQIDLTKIRPIYDTGYSRYSDLMRHINAGILDDLNTVTGNPEIVRLCNAFPNRSRDPESENYGTWHTSHSGVYDLTLKKLILRVQGEDEEYTFPLIPDSTVIENLVLSPISAEKIETNQNSLLQTVADTVFTEDIICKINYNNITYLIASDTIHEDYFFNKYFTLSGTLDGTAQILIRIYGYPDMNGDDVVGFVVTGARRYDSKPVSFGRVDPGVNSFLPINNFYGYKNMGFITFSSEKEFKLGTKDGWHGDQTKLEYSTDKETWDEWDGSTPIDAVIQTSTLRYEIYIRAEGGTTTYDLENDIPTIFNIIRNGEADITIKGNLTSIIDYSKLEKEINFGDYTFAWLFSNITDLYNVSNLILPVDAKEYGYYKTFANCIHLRLIPETYPTGLKSHCFDSMFENCESISSVKELSKTDTLAEGCFKNMFKGCKKLATTPILPYTTMFKDCYLGMFEDCITIRKPMELPATTLAEGCYKQMFKGCVSLSGPSNLPAINLKPECYREMYMNCTNIEWGGTGRYFRVPYNGLGIDSTDTMTDMFVGTTGVLPEITGTPLMHKQYYYLTKDFYFTSPDSFSIGAQNWSTASEMKYSFDNITWYTWDKKTDINVPLLEGNDMYTVYFRGTGADTLNGSKFKISSLNKNVEVIGDLGQLISDAVAANTYGENTFRGVFMDCNELSSAGGLLLPSKIAAHGYESLFENCANLTTPPVSIDVETMTDYCCNRMFYNCTSLTKAPALNFKELAESCCNAMFYGCELITSVELPDIKVAAKDCYKNMFDGCVNLMNVNALTFTTLAEACCMKMFNGCTSLTRFDDLLATQAAPYCYSEMFFNTSLTAPPAILLTALAPYCCSYMFGNCTALESVVSSLPSNMREGCYAMMYYRCESLTDTGVLEVNETQAKCCYGMFSECKKLTNASSISLKDPTAEECYSSMFENCVNLVDLPSIDYLGITSIGVRAFSYFLMGCSKITKPCELPINSTIILKEEAFSNMFENCINLDFEEETIFRFSMDGSGCYKEMFKGCTKLTKYPKVYPASLKEECFMGMFEDCVSIVEDFKDYQLRYKELAVNCYTKMFKGCIKITAPMNFGVIFENLNTSVPYMEEMFANCIGIVWYPIGDRYTVMANNGVTPINYSACAKNMFLNNRYATGSSSSVVPITPIFNQPYFLKPTYGLELHGGTTITNQWANAINQELYVSMDDKFETLYPFPLGTTLTHNSENGGTFYLIGKIDDVTIHGGEAISESIETEIKTAKGIIGDYTSIYGWLGGAASSIYSISNRYAYMFAGAKSLQYADGLSLATQLNTENMYLGLFANSGIIKTIGFRDVEVVSEGKGGYAYMYAFCDRLTTVEQASDMPTYLPAHLFQGTFMGCTSLVDLGVPALPFFDLDSNACDGMFMGSGLTSIPLLNRMSFNSAQTGQCRRMFKNCLGLTTVLTGLLPDQTADMCYEQMFMGCTNLMCTPRLPSAIVMTSAYSSMFSHCKALTNDGLEVILGETLYNNAYHRMFEYCDGLTQVPLSLFNKYYITFSGTTAYAYMFSHCSNINFTKGDIINIQKYDKQCFSHTFEYCTSITVLPTIKGELVAKCFDYMFYNCTGLLFGPNGDEFKLTSTSSSLDVGLMFKGTSYLTSEFKLETPQVNVTYYIFEEEDCVTFTNIEHKSGKIELKLTTFGQRNGIYGAICRIDDGPIKAMTTPYVYQEYNSPSAALTITAKESIKFLCLYSKYNTETKLSGVDSCVISTTGDKYKVSGKESKLLGDNQYSHMGFTDQFHSSVPHTQSNTCLVDASEFIPTSTRGNSHYSRKFGYCVNLKYPPKEIPILSGGDGSYWFEYMFRGCVNLLEAPPIVFDGQPGFVSKLYISGMYTGCEKLTYIPDFPDSKEVRAYNVCSGCAKLLAGPSLFASDKTDISAAFRDCGSLRKKPRINLSAFESAIGGGDYVFENCPNIKEPYLLTGYGDFSIGTQGYVKMYANTGITWSKTGTAFKVTASNPYSAYRTIIKDMFAGTKTDGTVTLPTNNGWVGTPILNTTYYFVPEKPSQYVVFSAPTSFHVKVSTNYQWSWDGENWAYGDNTYVASDNNKLYLAGQIPASNSGLMKYKNTENGTSDTLIITGGNDQVKITGALQALTGNSLNASYLFKNTTIYDASGLIFPATLPANACKEMFAGCTKLVAPPNLGGTSNLGDYAYSGMFKGCTGLTTVPNLSGLTIGTGSYQEMFMDCANLTGTPKIPAASTIGDYAYQRMYAGCKSLTTGTLFNINACTLGKYAMEQTYKDCTNITTITGNIPIVVTLNDYVFSETFKNTGILDASDIVIQLPSSSAVKKYVYNGMFSGCVKLVKPATINESLLTLNNYTGCFKSMYEGCSELTSLPARLEKITTLAAECYKAMFKKCVKIEMPCALPALKLLDSCYMEMFSGCTSIKWFSAGAPWQIPEVGTGTETGANARTNMFYGNSGTNIPITPYLNTEYYLSAIPEENDWITMKSIVPGESIGTIDIGYGGGVIRADRLPVIVYSTDNVNWTTADCITGVTINCSSDTLYLSCPIEKYKDKVVDIVLKEHVGHGIKVSGKIESITRGKKSIVQGYCPSVLFGDDTPDLPEYGGFKDFSELELTPYCSEMFGCGDVPTSSYAYKMTKIPNSIKECVPGDYQCSSLFCRCKRITETPKVIKSTNCAYMFSGCTGLTTVSPNMLQPESGLLTYSYRNMFEDCINLTVPPFLPSNVEIIEDCCAYMFRNCSSINWTYNGTPYKVKNRQSFMFLGNKGEGVVVDGTPNVSSFYEPAVSTYFYNGGFEYTTITAEKPFTVKGPGFAYSYDGINWNFEQQATSSLVDGVETIFISRLSRDGNPNNYTPSYSIYSEHEDAKIKIKGNIHTIAGVLLGDVENTDNVKTYTAKQLFSCRNVFTLQSSLYDASEFELDMEFFDCNGNPINNMFEEMFMDNSSLELIPNSFKTMSFSNKPVNFVSAFSGCTNLKSADINLSSYEGDKDFNLSQMFYECINLSNAPAFPAIPLIGATLDKMYYRCKKLTKPSDIVLYGYYNGKFTSCQEMYAYSGAVRPANVKMLNASQAGTAMWKYAYRDTPMKFVGYPTSEVWRINTPGVTTGYIDRNQEMFKGCENDPGRINYNQDYYFWEVPTEWVTFSAPTPFTITLESGKYLYSKDKTTWTKTTGTAITSNNDNELYVITNNTLPDINNGNRVASIQITGGSNQVKVAGRADYLNYDLGYIFKDCLPLYDASELVFRTTHMEEWELYNINEYPHMFEGCTNLVYPPSGIIHLNGYDNRVNAEAMFRNCKKLTGTVKIAIDPDATILEPETYSSLTSMFEGCEQLTSVTFTGFTEDSVLAKQNDIFKGCKSLISVTGLDFKKLVKCESMFEGCIKLQSIPTKNLCDIESCKRMFYGCKELTFAETPALSFTSIKGDYACKEMFAGCTSITEVPVDLLADINLFKDAGKQNDIITGVFTSMFEGCTSLIKAPNLLLEETCNYRDMNDSYDPPKYYWCLPELYKYMFKDCTSLAEHPELHLKAATTSICEGMFKGCTSLEFPMEFKTEFYQHWDPAYYNGNTENATKEMYMGCTGIKWYSYGKPYSVPIDGSTENLNMSIYAENMFVGCTSVEGGEVPNTPVFNSPYFLYPSADKAVKFTGTKPFGVRIDNHFVYKIDDEETWHRGVDRTDANRIEVNPGSTLYMYGYTAGMPRTEEAGVMIGFDIPKPVDEWFMERSEVDPQIKISGELFSLTGPGYNAHRMFYVEQEAMGTWDYVIIGPYDVRELIFPEATTKSCYEGMFEYIRTTSIIQIKDGLGNQMLTYGPTALPAKKVAAYAYRNMFARCGCLLTCMDELPADRTPIPITTYYEEQHYKGIFNECQMDYCYAGMFSECKSLTKAPKIHLTPGVYKYSTTSRYAYFTYANMFANCISLTNPPEVVENSSTSYLYKPNEVELNTGDMYKMFWGCTSLRKTMEFGCWGIYHTSPSSEYYPCRQMYSGCTNLVFDSTGVYTFNQKCTHDAAANWSLNMFEGCGGTPPTNVQINTNYKYSYDL